MYDIVEIGIVLNGPIGSALDQVEGLRGQTRLLKDVPSTNG